MKTARQVVPKHRREDRVVHVSMTDARKDFKSLVRLTRQGKIVVVTYRRVPKVYVVSSDQYQRWLKVESMARWAELPNGLLARAISIFGSAEKAHRWLLTYNLALECVPAQAVRDGRIGEVNDLLNSVESGHFA